MRRAKRICTMALLVMLVGMPELAFAQEPTPDAAQVLFQTGNWNEAV